MVVKYDGFYLLARRVDKDRVHDMRHDKDRYADILLSVSAHRTMAFVMAMLLRGGADLHTIPGHASMRRRLATVRLSM